MLYVFLVESGQMLTTDTCYTTETVAALKSHVARLGRIPSDKQVMLVSGGINLDNSCRVAQYCAGTDTNPIFVFSKLTIEASIPPAPCINYGTDKVLSDAISEVVLLPATHETVSDAYKLAKETIECDKNRMEASERLIHDQHLQQQGWAAAIANLDDHLASFTRRVEKFQTICNTFLKAQDESLEMLSKVTGIIELLGRIPLLKSLQTLVSSPVTESNPMDAVIMEEENQTTGPSLLDWIYQQDPRSSLEDMVEQCRAISEQISKESVEKLTTEINDLLKFVDRPDMKEVKGLEHRLYQLDHFITNTRAVMDKQTKFFQKFSSQLESSTRMDCECLSEYWKNHKKDLMDLSEGHNQIKIFKKRCCKAKEELSNNLHVRLQWVMWVEQLIMEKERQIKIESEKIKRQRKHLKILQQVHDGPRMYIAALVEITRRRHYSTQFLTWGRNVASVSGSLYTEEIKDRQNFSETFGKHFIQSLFHGLHDEPSKFATTAPRSFDHNIPEITPEDIEKLKKAVPELAGSLIMPPKKNIYTRLCINVNEKVFQELRAISPDVVEERLSLKLHSTMKDLDVAIDTSQSVCPHTGADSPRPQTSDSHSKTLSVVDGRPPTTVVVDTAGEYTEDKDAILVKSESPPKQAGDTQHPPGESCRLSSEAEAVNRSVEQSSESLSSRRQHPKGHLASDTSPEVETSQEFTTADFYFDESMPSSIEAPSHKGVPKEDLQKLLQEKCELSEKLSRELQACRASFGLTSEKLKALKDATERSLPEFRERLCDLHELMRQNQIDFITHANQVQENLLEAIRMFNENKEKERTDNFLAFQKEHELAMQTVTEKLSKADQQIELMDQEKLSLKEELMKNKNEREMLVEQMSLLNIEKEDSIKEVTQKYLLETEVLLEKQRSEYQELLDQNEKKLSEKSSRLLCLESQLDSMTQKVSCMSETFSQKAEREKTELIEKLKRNSIIEKNDAIVEAKQLLVDEHTASLDALKLEKLNLQGKFSAIQKEQDEEKEQALSSLRSELSVAKEAEICSLSQQLTAKLRESEADLEQTRVELLKFKRLATRPTQCDGQCQTEESVISVAIYEQILRESKSDHEAELEAEKRASQTMFMKQKAELEQLKTKLESEAEEKLSIQRMSLSAEKQVFFNQALSKLADEKDQLISNLKIQVDDMSHRYEDLSRAEEVNMINQQMLVTELEEKIAVMAASQDQLEKELTISKSVQADSMNKDTNTTEPDNADEGCEEEFSDKLMELEKTIKCKDDRIEKLQSKVMELSMSASVFEQDKVSITSFQSGDLVLLCLDEEHGHYVVFTVGNTLHFLHTDCLDNLGLRSGPTAPREPWVLGVITEKEYCIAKKSQNRYRVPLGTKFYRVRAKPWPKDRRLTREGSGQGPAIHSAVASSPLNILITTTTTTATTTTTVDTSSSSNTTSS